MRDEIAANAIANICGKNNARRLRPKLAEAAEYFST